MQRPYYPGRKDPHWIVAFRGAKVRPFAERKATIFRPETRPEWGDRSFHYDLRIPIAGRMIYIETILIDDDPSDPIIRVVNIHDA